MTRFLHAIVAMVAPFLMPITVEATGYTCQSIEGNPMNVPGMCVALASGSEEVMSPGMACPRDWMGMGFYVPGQGVLYCDDTGAHDFLFTARGIYRPHTDFRFTTLNAVWGWGKHTVVMYRLRSPRKDACHASSFDPACALCRARPFHDLRGYPYAPSEMMNGLNRHGRTRVPMKGMMNGNQRTDGIHRHQRLRVHCLLDGERCD